MYIACSITNIMYWSIPINIIKDYIYTSTYSYIYVHIHTYLHTHIHT